MKAGLSAWVAGLAGVLLAGCALFADPGRIQPGTPVAEVLAQLGRPSARYPQDAGEHLQYSYQPAGQRVFDIDVDAQGRVTRVEQVLDEPLFAQRIQPDRWTRADVLRELLQHCTSVKTVRLCLQLGREASLPWVDKLDPAALPTGSDRPWVSRSTDGLLVLKP